MLRFAPLGESSRILTRAGNGLGDAAAHATRIPPGHPEGYLEAFANIYSDIAEVIAARLVNREPDPRALNFPSVEDGVHGVRFIEAAVESSANGAVWTDAQIQWQANR